MFAKVRSRDLNENFWNSSDSVQQVQENQVIVLVTSPKTPHSREAVLLPPPLRQTTTCDSLAHKWLHQET